MENERLLIVGTRLSDVILGRIRAEHLRGLAGDDQLFGDGRMTNEVSQVRGDVVLAGADDLVQAAQGDDQAWGDGTAQVRGPHEARVIGGNDIVKGGAGNDLLNGDGEATSTEGGTADASRWRATKSLGELVTT